MEDFIGIVFLLILLALVGAIAYGIVGLARRGRDFADIDPGIGTVRRLYFYLLSFVALMMAVVGVVLVAQDVLEALFGGAVLARSDTRLALGLASALVGVPLWAVHWRLVGKYVRELPVEARSIVRKLYIYLVLGVAAAVAIGAAVDVLQWLLRSDSYSGYPLPALIAWSGVWLFHWRLESREGQSTPETRAVRRLYLYLMAAGALSAAAVGLGQLIHTVLLREAYDALTSLQLLSPAESGLFGEQARHALALILATGPVWVAHWVYFARDDHDSTLRQLYLYAFAIFGGTSTVLTALGIIIYGVLVWTFGAAGGKSAEAHFRFLPAALASLAVGGGVLGYHSWAARREASSPERQGARTSYPYALAALGLFVLAGGIVTLVLVTVGLLTEAGRPTLAGEGLWRKPVALIITLGVLGAPIWGYFWTSTQRRVNAGDLEERAGLPRRVFIFVVLAAGMLALLGSVSHLVFVFLRELLEGDLSNVLRDAKASIAIIVPAAIFLPYYWMVYRADRRTAAEAAPPEARPRPRRPVTVLANEGGGAYLRRLEAALCYSVSALQWADPDASLPELSEAQLQELVRQIGDAAGPNVLLVPDSAAVRVLSYR